MPLKGEVEPVKPTADVELVKQVATGTTTVMRAVRKVSLLVENQQ